MPDLIAQGDQRRFRWRRTLPAERTVVVGRESGNWSVPWDRQISRQHVDIRWRPTHNFVEVRSRPEATNPVFYLGHANPDFQAKPGEHFVIGATTFSVVATRASISMDVPNPVARQTYSAEYLRSVHFRNAEQQIEVLSRLPEMITGSMSDDELSVQLVNILFTGIPRATAAALVQLVDVDRNERIEILHWDQSSSVAESFQPSERLIRETLLRGESVVHVWKETFGVEAFTLPNESDWAFCTPVPGTACRDWALYVTGTAPADHLPHTSYDLRDDLKFAELAATTVGNLCDVRLLQRRQAALASFFSPRVLEAIGNADPDIVLAPRKTEVTVLFCDLRGFSRQSEKYGDDLLGLLHRVNGALGIMTRHILEQGGVIGDFHGDSAMGFWGWPIPQAEMVLLACQAALGIRASFETAAAERTPTLVDFRIGVGIATGPAVAGKIGSVDQVKVTAFGPVVNVASRLEGINKWFGSATLLDEPTAAVARKELPADAARIRRVAIIQPYGMQRVMEVSELLPPVGVLPGLDEQQLHRYDAALDMFTSGDWQQCRRQLDELQVRDHAARYLHQYMAAYDFQPPADWDGVLKMHAK